MAGLFTFCTPNFNNQSDEALRPTKAHEFKRPFKRKRRSPDGGRGFFGSFGGNKVTGGKPSLVLLA